MGRIDLSNTVAAWDANAAIGAQHEAVGWSPVGQTERHAFVASLLNFFGIRPDDVVLDWGCGTGEFYRHVPPDAHYVGLDWSPGMVERARRDHPTGSFYLEDNPSAVWRADLVVVIGTWNLAGNWSAEQSLYAASSLWKASGCRRMVLSLMAKAPDPDLYIEYGPTWAAELIERISPASAMMYYLWRRNDMVLVLNR